jgi:hypothetical protein
MDKLISAQTLHPVAAYLASARPRELRLGERALQSETAL